MSISLFLCFFSNIFFYSLILAFASFHRLFCYIPLSMLPIYIPLSSFPLLSFTFWGEGFIFQTFFSLTRISPFHFFLSRSPRLFSLSFSNLRPSIATNLWEWITSKLDLHRFGALHAVARYFSILDTEHSLRLLLTKVPEINYDL